MEKSTIVKVIAAAVGGFTAFTLVSLYPVKVGILIVAVLAYEFADKLTK